MHKPTVIGIAASRAGSGKTTVAQALVNNAGFVRLPLAEPLKRIGGVILREAGVSRFDAKRFLYHERNIVIPEIGVTGRHLLQTLGTDWGRRCISPHLWTTIWEQSLMQLRHAAHDGGRDLHVVVDDVRFPSEADLIRTLGGFMWMVERPRTRQERQRELCRRFSPGRFLRSPQQLLPWKLFSSLHPSEGGLNHYPCFDARFRNDGTIHDLLQQVRKEVTSLGFPLNGLGPFDATPTGAQVESNGTGLVVPLRRPIGPA
jgi:hypothetical protein